MPSPSGGAASALSFDEAAALGERLRVSPGVHHPSPFSVLLASALPPLDGLRAVDAGCGAGLVTIAMLLRGADGVTAQDRDPAALADTRVNVGALLGTAALERLVCREGDWQEPGVLAGDLVAVNPPQRPSAVLPAIPPAEAHLHTGGGRDGLDGLRLVLRNADADVVLSTASTLVRGDPAEAGAVLGWRASVVAERVLHHAEPWWMVTNALDARVRVWRFERR
jgi:methylase of polypeptide subunit release factors